MKDMSDPSASRGRCPICGKAETRRFRPFCSKRCADIDLHRWLSGRYAIPVAETDEAEQASKGEAEAEE